MKNTQKVMKAVDKTVEILCDICGESCCMDTYTFENPARADHGQEDYAFEYLPIEVAWGYHSPWDLEKWSAEICVDCVKKHLEPLIKFRKNEYHPWT